MELRVAKNRHANKMRNCSTASGDWMKRQTRKTGVPIVKNASVLVVSILVAGCAAREVPPITVSPSHVDHKVAEAMQRAANANRAIAEIEAAASAPNAPAPAQLVPSGAKLPPELNELVSVDWRGPLEPLLKGIADEIGFTLHVTGAAPASPVMVTLYRTEEPAWRVIRDAGTLATSEAAVILNPSEKRIEIRYGPRSVPRSAARATVTK